MVGRRVAARHLVLVVVLVLAALVPGALVGVVPASAAPSSTSPSSTTPTSTSPSSTSTSPTPAIPDDGAPATGGEGAPVAPEVVAKAATGDVRVIAVTAAPGEQVVDDVVAAVPEGSLSDVSAGAAPQVVATVDADGLDALRDAPGVTQVVEDKVNRLTDDGWPTAVGLDLPHELGYDGGGRTVAVLDAGVQADHPFLQGRVVDEACFSTNSGVAQSLCPGQADEAHGSGAATPCVDISGCAHGTHVAGLAIGGEIASPAPLTGTASGASLIAVKIFSKGTSGAVCGGPPPCLVAYDSDIVEALTWLHDLKQDADPRATTLDAVNLSLGGGLYGSSCDDRAPTLAAAFGQMRSLGIVPVVATGNNGARGSVSSPACLSSAVSVGATTGTGAMASYGNLASTTTLVAPGTSMTSSIPGSTYGSMSGTSMATPLVTGAIAVLRQQTPGASVDALVERMRATATNVASPVGTMKELQLDAAVAGVPGDVTGLTATAGFQSAVVSWGAPTYAGAPALTGYTVTASPGGATCTTTSAVRSCRLGGLSNGTSYTFRVVAANTTGSGAGTTAAAIPRALPGVTPFGALDVVTAGVGEIAVGGWALDPETAAPIAVHVYVDGAGTAFTADGGRPDVDAAFGYGAAHGFSGTIKVAGGPHTVCAYAINVAGTGGGNALIACRAVTVPTGPPVGNLDVVIPGPGRVAVAGWAIDPDVAGPIAVHVYVDSIGTGVTAGDHRDDIAAFFGPFGGNHAFTTTVAAPAGVHDVCAYGINVAGTNGANALLGCTRVTVPSGSPVGALDVAVRNPGGSVSVAGWAVDWDQADPIDVHVYVTAPGQPSITMVLDADLERPDVAAYLPMYTARHGYSATTSGAVPAGATVCTYGINVGAGGNALLGCRTVP